MNGYLQCLIDQYSRHVKSAIAPVERHIYTRILTDLIGLEQFCDKDKKPTVDDIPRKYVVADFKGDMNGFVEYLKKLKGDI